jgi:hypothetical protein
MPLLLLLLLLLLLSLAPLPPLLISLPPPMFSPPLSAMLTKGNLEKRFVRS